MCVFWIMITISEYKYMCISQNLYLCIPDWVSAHAVHQRIACPPHPSLCSRLSGLLAVLMQAAQTRGTLLLNNNAPVSTLFRRTTRHNPGLLLTASKSSSSPMMLTIILL